MVLALLTVVVPIVIMSLFRDRKERYLLPMVAPAAVLCAHALSIFAEPEQRRRALDQAIVWIHWGVLLLIPVGLAIAGTTKLRGLEGQLD